MNMLQNNEWKIRKLLDDFKQDSQKDLLSGIFNDFHKFSIDDGDYDERRLIRCFFEGIKKFLVIDKPIEKVNWEIPFTYKNIKGSFAHQKFGFRIYIDNRIQYDLAAQVSNEITLLLNKAYRLLRPILEEAGRASLQKGEIIIENKLYEISETYKFFNKQARLHFKKAKVPASININASPQAINYDYKSAKEAEYLIDAAIITFFSLLEHICVLSLAFINDEDAIDIGFFAKNKWYEKFKKVFTLKVPKFMESYDYLYKLSKCRRNPKSHGYLDEANTIFSFYYEPAKHRIPMSLYTSKLTPNIKKIEVTDLDRMDSFLSLIRKHPRTRKIIMYLDAHLDVSYDKDSLINYRVYMSMSNADAKDYVEYISRRDDDYANMDW